MNHFCMSSLQNYKKESKITKFITIIIVNFAFPYLFYYWMVYLYVYWCCSKCLFLTERRHAPVTQVKQQGIT